MKEETVGYTPESVVNAVKENAPPTSYVPEADWNAWAGEAGWHEWLHTLPSKNHIESMHVVWEYGVITSTFAFLIPEIINETYETMEWLYFEVAVGAFVRPQDGFDQLPAQIIKESADIVGTEKSQADEKMSRRAQNQIYQEEREQSIEDRIKRSKELNNPTSDADTTIGSVEDPFDMNGPTETTDADNMFSEEEPTVTAETHNIFSEENSTTTPEEEKYSENNQSETGGIVTDGSYVVVSPSLEIRSQF